MRGGDEKQAFCPCLWLPLPYGRPQLFARHSDLSHSGHVASFSRIILQGFWLSRNNTSTPAKHVQANSDWMRSRSHTHPDRSGPKRSLDPCCRSCQKLFFFPTAAFHGGFEMNLEQTTDLVMFSFSKNLFWRSMNHTHVLLKTGNTSSETRTYLFHNVWWQVSPNPILATWTLVKSMGWWLMLLLTCYKNRYQPANH